MNIYISASWKLRHDVRSLADMLRNAGHEVYDFTDPKCRNTPEMPPEKYPEQFDPLCHNYRKYLDKDEWRAAMMCNKDALDWCDQCWLLLPCGLDATADWAYAVGRGKATVVIGDPPAGERSPTHLWADAMFPRVLQALEWLGETKSDNPSFDNREWRNFPARRR